MSGSDVSGGVAVEPVLALGVFVFLGVENCLIVVGPDDRADALGVIGQRLASAQIFHRQIDWRKPVLS